MEVSDSIFPRNLHPWKQFEALVRRILEVNNFSVKTHLPRGDQGFDFMGTLGNEQWAIEVKFYRTARPQPSLIEAAAQRLIKNGIIAQARKGMLIVSCVLSAEYRQALESKFSVIFVDRVDLSIWASTSPELAAELNALIEDDSALSPSTTLSRTDPRTKSRLLEKLLYSAEDTRGTDLCNELKSLKRGRVDWAKYEKVCANILKYLFPNDLHGWHPQKRTDDGLNRFDFVCRVRPTTEFWKFLIDHLNSRYVLFEFKNYSGKIKQGQILTTEKYLLERGLRRVAIILTRVGADSHAIAMAQGAMREHGKLMLIVNDEKLCEMLHMKERGDVPTDCLFDLADDFLLALPR